MSVLKQFVSLFTGNSVCQSLLEYNVRFSHYLMGIGAGTRVHTSGEMSLVKYLNQCSATPTMVFDVGANIGQFCGLISGHCDVSRMEIHSFEPNAEAFRVLRERTQDCASIRCNHCALGAAAGTATLYSDRPASALSSLTRRQLDHVGKEMTLSQQVDVQTLDAYCAEHNIDRIHLLKIDVEGHEHDVLSGGLRMFEESRVDAVTFEFGGCHIDTRGYFRDYYGFFTEREMQIFRITPRGYLRRIDRYAETQEQFLTTNFLAVRRPAA